MSRLVKASDLNHHGTLFAGQMAKWIVEACFVETAKLNKRTDNLVCVKIHGLEFKKPIENGDIVDMEAEVVHEGKTSLTVLGRVYVSRHEKNHILETLVTFVTLGEDGKPAPHNIKIEIPASGEKHEIWERLEKLKK
ncbi:MAG: acyl-CoA thioesterase [Candidatus Methanofastidiosia archaeon]